MNKTELKEFQELLLNKRRDIVRRAEKTRNEDMSLDASDLPDEMDLASSEYLKYFELRLRGREKHFLRKIDKALAKIEAGTFGLCEECEEPIGPKRLKARPEAPLCIKCKEEQERDEKAFA